MEAEEQRIRSLSPGRTRVEGEVVLDLSNEQRRHFVTAFRRCLERFRRQTDSMGQLVDDLRSIQETAIHRHHVRSEEGRVGTEGWIKCNCWCGASPQKKKSGKNIYE